MFKSTSASSLNTATNKSDINNGNNTKDGIQKSYTIATCVVEKKRGFKPSDRHDPNKKKFLTELSQQIWQKNNESTNVAKKIDLHKIFTPATDAEEILPKNRKLYASSAFYSPTLHPTVEDQVELARRISHSLSDISNQQSRGQSMYVNRKKRSVKWVHEGCGQEESIKTSLESLNQSEHINEENMNNNSHIDKVPLKFLMNPCGKMRDVNSLRESINTETGLLSPHVSVEVMSALHMQKGKGAELFAKRRKISEKWIVDENNIGAQSPSGLLDYHQNHQQPKPPTSPSILPAYTDTARHRVQLNLHQNQLLEKYAKPALKVVQTPWEAALNSGSASTAFVEEQNLSPYPTPILTRSPTPQVNDVSQGSIRHLNLLTGTDVYDKPTTKDDHHKYQIPTNNQLPHAQPERQQYLYTNSQRELAYKPSIPQGWKATSMSLPKAVNEAARNCEEFNTKDETEIINLIGEVKESKLANFLPATASRHQFVNHLVKSPELRVSPIPIETQVIFDIAVQELLLKHQKEKEKQEVICRAHNESNEEKPKNLNNDGEMNINVRKQLQQYEYLHQQYAKQLQQEQLLQKKREVAKLKALNTHNKKTNIENIDKSTCSIQKLESYKPEKIQENEEDEYIQIPIKELIVNFEHQIRQEEKSTDDMLFSTSFPRATFANKNNSWESHNEDLYMPKEIPIQSYAPPPVTSIPPSVSPYFLNVNYDFEPCNMYKTSNTASPAPYYTPDSTLETKKPFNGCNTFPISKTYQQGFSSTYGNTQPKKQQYLPPKQTVPQNNSQNVPQVGFNPSPLPYDKLAKFENPPTNDVCHVTRPNRNYQLKVRANKVRNISPAPFAGSHLSHRPCPPSVETYDSLRPTSTFGRNTPNTYANIISNQILNAPTYNSLARGWGCSDSNNGISAGYQLSRKHILPISKYPNIVNTASVPYTDF